MNKKEFLNIILKVLGIYFLSISLDSFLNLVKSFTSNNNFYTIVNLFGTGLYFSGFYMSFFKSIWIIDKMNLKVLDENAVIKIEKRDFLHIILIGTGIIISFFAIEGIWNLIWYQSIMNDIPSNNELIEGRKTLFYIVTLGVPVAKLVIGLILIFSSGFFAKRVKYIVKRKPEDKIQ